MKSECRQTRSDEQQRPLTLAWLAASLGSFFMFYCESNARAQDPLPRPTSATQPYALPDPQRVFRLESEAQLRERMARESRLGINALGLKYDIAFPRYPAVPAPEQIVRGWAPLTETVEAPFVAYRRLYFEQPNFERYGWDLGVLSPFLSQAAFYFDLVTLPYHAGIDPFRRYECNAGYCLPGDPVPLLLYPPQWSWSGALSEAAVVGLGFVFFP